MKVENLDTMEYQLSKYCYFNTINKTKAACCLSLLVVWEIHNWHELTHNGLHVFVRLIQLAQVQKRHPVEEKQERERSSYLVADVPHLHS